MAIIFKDVSNSNHNNNDVRNVTAETNYENKTLKQEQLHVSN